MGFTASLGCSIARQRRGAPPIAATSGASVQHRNDQDPGPAAGVATRAWTGTTRPPSRTFSTVRSWNQPSQPAPSWLVLTGAGTDGHRQLPVRAGSADTDVKLFPSAGSRLRADSPSRPRWSVPARPVHDAPAATAGTSPIRRIGSLAPTSRASVEVETSFAVATMSSAAASWPCGPRTRRRLAPPR